MSRNKMKTCTSCGEKIAASAKRCPKCGTKNQKPIYKRPWFIILVLLIVAAAGAGAGGGKSEDTSSKTSSSKEEKKEEITYTAYDVSQLMDDLDSNAMNASDTYKDQYVELTGRLSNIDSSGEYIDILPENDEFAIIGVQCYVKNEEQKESIKEMSIDDTITVKGKITDVGEVLGYSLDIDSVSKK